MAPRTLPRLDSTSPGPASRPIAALSMPSRLPQTVRSAPSGSQLPRGDGSKTAIPSMDVVAWIKPRLSSVRMLSKKEQLLIVTQLSIMLRSGVDLADAVRSIHLRSSNPTIREVMGSVYRALEAGQSLSAAILGQHQRFGGVMAATVSAGEASGRLPEVLGRLSSILRDELRLQNAVKSAISYPLVLVLVTGMVLMAMIFFVLPQFSGIYDASQTPTPAVTRMLLDVAATVRVYWWLCGLGAAVTLAGCVVLLRSGWGKASLDQGLLRLPLLRRVWPPLLSGRMFRLQGAMLQSGVPMLEVLQLTRTATHNSCFVSMIDDIETAVTQGNGMAGSLLGSPCMPDGAAEMIATAEANGQLGPVLETIGEYYESEGEQQLRDTVKIAEPAIIVVLGLVVGCIVLAVMLPLLDLSAASSGR